MPVKTIHFNDFFDVLWKEAQRMGMNQTEFMRSAGLPKQRFTELSKRKINLTGHLFSKLMGGLALTTEHIEHVSGKKFTKEQKNEIKMQSFLNRNRDVIEDVASDRALEKAFRAFVLAKRKQ